MEDSDRSKQPEVKRITDDTYISMGPEGEKWLRTGYGYGGKHTSKEMLEALQKHGPFRVRNLKTYHVFASNPEDMIDILRVMDRKGAIKLYEENEAP